MVVGCGFDRSWQVDEQSVAMGERTVCCSKVRGADRLGKCHASGVEETCMAFMHVGSAGEKKLRDMALVSFLYMGLDNWVHIGSSRIIVVKTNNDTNNTMNNNNKSNKNNNNKK